MVLIASRIEINKYCPVRWATSEMNKYQGNLVLTFQFSPRSVGRRLHAGTNIFLLKASSAPCTIAKIKRDRRPSICLSSQLMALWDDAPHLQASHPAADALAV